MTNDATMTVECRPCQRCGKRALVTVLVRDFERWKGGEYIQRAFPEMPPEQRELLISGTHPACWDELFSEEE